VNAPGVAIRLALMETVSCVGLTTVAAMLAPVRPKKDTMAPGWKPRPVIVNVNAGPPAEIDVGLKLEIVGSRINFAALEVPAGLCTVIETSPAPAISEADTGAVNWAALT
jgi:hypothetical protein